MKHAYLCLDPGITTGWALLAADGSIMGTSVWGTGELAKSLDLVIRQAFTAGYKLTVVIERMPNTGKMGVLGQKLENVRHIITNALETYELHYKLVAPGEWKPSRVAKTTVIPKRFKDTPIVIHQRDAIKMGRYIIDRMQEKA